jgi:hypothetical protein
MFHARDNCVGRRRHYALERLCGVNNVCVVQTRGQLPVRLALPRRFRERYLLLASLQNLRGRVEHEP